MRKAIIAGNWKMNTTVEEAITLVNALLVSGPGDSRVEVVVFPPYVSLWTLKEILFKSSIKIGAQNLYFEDKGAYTGEISPLMLKEICDYVIIGHSERRQYFFETDQIVSRKILAALKHGLKPIVCVGENLTQFEAGQTSMVVTNQINGSLSGIESLDDITIAYEPIWAIGTGRAATAEQANNTIRLIRACLASKFGQTTADNTRILYGGSVTSTNIAELMSQTDIDGGLVGGASLKAQEFLSIVSTTTQVKNQKR